MFPLVLQSRTLFARVFEMALLVDVVKNRNTVSWKSLHTESIGKRGRVNVFKYAPKQPIVPIAVLSSIASTRVAWRT